MSATRRWNASCASPWFLSIHRQERPEICEYPNSGKYMAYQRGVFTATQRTALNLDYWDGEP